MKKAILLIVGFFALVYLSQINTSASSRMTIQETQHGYSTYTPQTGEDLIVTVHVPTRFSDMNLVKSYIIGTYKGNSSHSTSFSPSKIETDLAKQTLTLTYVSSDFTPFDSSWMNDGISIDVEFTDGKTSWGVHVYEEFAQYSFEFFDNYLGNNNSIIIYTSKSSGLLSPPVPPSRDNYTFSGWYLEPDAITKYVFLPAPLTQNVKLYAGWTVDPIFPSDPDTNMPTVDPIIPSDPDTNPSSNYRNKGYTPSNFSEKASYPVVAIDSKKNDQLPKAGTNSSSLISRFGSLLLAFALRLIFLKKTKYL